MKKLLLMVTASLFISGCGGGAGSNSASSSSATSSSASNAGANKIEIKIKDKTYTLEQKSAYLYSDDMTINMPDKNVKTADHGIIVANYDLDMSLGPFMAAKKMTAPGNIRIGIKLQDKADTNKDAPPSAGEYASKYPDEFMKFFNVFIYTYADGKDEENKILGGYDNVKGGVKINSVNGDTVTGEIDIANQDNSVKGSFTAKIWKNPNAPK